MSFIETVPVWLLALIIFSLRVVDVSLGTVRTISVVQGWIKLSVVLGFFEVLIWIMAISQVFARINESPLLMVAFAGGFAAGNAAGITLERALALGSCAVQFISSDGKAGAIAARLRAMGQRVTTLRGEGRDGPTVVVYVTCQRRELAGILAAARAVDERTFYVVDRVAQTSQVPPLPHPTGWRAVLKIK